MSALSEPVTGCDSQPRPETGFYDGGKYSVLGTVLIGQHSPRRVSVAQDDGVSLPG
jgi:hypothetical protein